MTHNYPRHKPQPRPETGGPMTLEQLFLLYEQKRLRGKSYGTSGQYLSAIYRFREHVQHEPTTDDFNDDTMADFIIWLQETRGVVVDTAVSYCKKLLAIWRFACRQRLVEVWPEVELPKCPVRNPVAWSREEVGMIYKALQSQEGSIGQFRACDWWTALMLTFWDSAERLTAVISLRVDDVNLRGAWVNFRAETRKGKLRDRGVPLHPKTVEALGRIIEGFPRRNLLFEAPFGSQTLFMRYRTILRDAGLPFDRKRLFHCLRRSVASWFEALGHDATELLDHSMRKVTVDSYLSPQIVRRARPAEVLFRPDEE